MSSPVSRPHHLEVHLARRPVGEPRPEDFAFVRATAREPGDGEVLVRNAWMSVDPFMREWMHADGYAPPYAVGEVLTGEAVGEVVASRSADLPIGTTVSHFAGWREYAVLHRDAVTVVDTALAPPEVHLGALGSTGLTAYATLTRVLPVRPGDVVYVSAAAGATGSIAGQLARRLGAAKVIGSAGGAAKTRVLTEEFGFDTAIDHTRGRLREELAEAAPDGVDLTVELVGGEHLEAALDAARTGGRIAVVGAVSGYNATGPLPGPANIFSVATKELTLRGMAVTSYFPLAREWTELAAPLLADGSLRSRHTVVRGLSRAPEAFIGVLRGDNTGKMLVRLDI
ncbi:NADP-dependent oxidoreductase [Streptomyces qinzhouensis]|uniref:NADP-dependent oxidoreductase n=1 Tax=Streptomyces qinzhouensis TaxID=2599401 RepID=A0A5B8J839_9ACTN|nr:NADP-dependent oxidoreductase [Streptomyces qinzhouensis]QDY77446.1 NADP-dependent oxidoreductase [Streptomyces qinzhouensis]